MMRGRIFVIAATAGLAACGQPAGDNSAANATANAAAPAKKLPTYCFFKDAATKGWAASVDAGGNVRVTGKVHLDDRRYSGDLSQSEVTSDTASTWVTMAPNTTGVGAEDNWWDVNVTIPGSAAVKSVTVLCGKKTVAELTVQR
jgi:hypothetical protein